MFSRFYDLRFFLCACFYLGSATSFDEISYLDPPMRIQDSSQPFLLILSVFATTCCRKYARYLGKDTNRVDRFDVCNDIAIDIFVLQEKSAKIGLAALHHLLDGSDDVRIANNNSLVESREERATCNGKSEDLRVDFGDGLFSY